MAKWIASGLYGELSKIMVVEFNKVGKPKALLTNYSVEFNGFAVTNASNTL